MRRLLYDLYNISIHAKSAHPLFMSDFCQTNEQSRMTSLHGDPPVLNYRYLYDRADVRGTGFAKPMTNPGTIMHAISTGDEFQITKTLIIKAGMFDLFNSLDSNVTLFLCPDKYWKRNTPDFLLRDIDLQSASSIIRYATLQFPLTMSGMNLKRGYVENAHPRQNLLINAKMWGGTEIGIRPQSASLGPQYYETSRIIRGDIPFMNGVCHIVSSPVVPRLGM